MPRSIEVLTSAFVLQANALLAVETINLSAAPGSPKPLNFSALELVASAIVGVLPLTLAPLVTDIPLSPDILKT